LLRVFSNDPSPSDIYTLSLHDALPILSAATSGGEFAAYRHSASLRAFTPVFDGLWTRVNALMAHAGYSLVADYRPLIVIFSANRSEEHTSELQSLTNLVCRLLLEKKHT